MQIRLEWSVSVFFVLNLWGNLDALVHHSYFPKHLLAAIHLCVGIGSLSVHSQQRQLNTSSSGQGSYHLHQCLLSCRKMHLPPLKPPTSQLVVSAMPEERAQGMKLLKGPFCGVC